MCLKVINSGSIQGIETFQSRAIPGMAHVNSSSSPLHTGAMSALIPGELIVTPPVPTRLPGSTRIDRKRLLLLQNS